MARAQERRHRDCLRNRRRQQQGRSHLQELIHLAGKICRRQVRHSGKALRRSVPRRHQRRQHARRNGSASAPRTHRRFRLHAYGQGGKHHLVRHGPGLQRIARPGRQQAHALPRLRRKARQDIRRRKLRHARAHSHRRQQRQTAADHQGARGFHLRSQRMGQRRRDFEYRRHHHEYGRRAYENCTRKPIRQ